MKAKLFSLLVAVAVFGVNATDAEEKKKDIPTVVPAVAVNNEGKVSALMAEVEIDGAIETLPVLSNTKTKKLYIQMPDGERVGVTSEDRPKDVTLVTFDEAGDAHEVDQSKLSATAASLKGDKGLQAKIAKFVGDSAADATPVCFFGRRCCWYRPVCRVWYPRIYCYRPCVNFYYGYNYCAPVYYNWCW